MIGNSISNDCGAYSPTNFAGDYGSIGYGGYGTTALPSGEVPEPATLALFMLGLCGTALLHARRRPVRTVALKPAA
jgi:hypothetical protein